MVELVAVVLIFGMPIYVVKRIYDYRERKLRKAAGNEELEALREERKLLKERVENLETIVCNVDFELNQRIQQLASSQSQVGALPASAAGAAAAEGEVASAVSAIGAVSTTGAVSATGAGGGTTAAAGAAPGAAAVSAPAGLASVARESTALDVSRRRRPVAAAPTELEPGDVLATRYTIQRLLGRGGMGAVYLAQDEVLDELVAVKVVSAALASADPAEVADRFRREASAARRVSSQNVIRIHDLGEASGGLLYISMEFFPGKTLAEILDRRGALDDEECRDLVGQICDGLGAAHRAGVIHRDLKPQNVLVGERNAVKLIDFGLAKATFHPGMTATGLILGTPEYMSPEQIKGLVVDARSDIYSLGALTYHAVAGKPPFSGGSPIAVGFAHLTETPEPPVEVREGISRRLSDMILAALAKDPRQRPQSVDEFRKAL